MSCDIHKREVQPNLASFHYKKIDYLWWPKATQSLWQPKQSQICGRQNHHKFVL